MELEAGRAVTPSLSTQSLIEPLDRPARAVDTRPPLFATQTNTNLYDTKYNTIQYKIHRLIGAIGVQVMFRP